MEDKKKLQEFEIKLAKTLTSVNKGKSLYYWEIDFEDEKKPALYVDDRIFSRVGFSKDLTPNQAYEEVYKAVVLEDRHLIEQSIKRMFAGEVVEVTFRISLPSYTNAKIRCYGRCIESANSMKLVGILQNMTEVSVLKNRKDNSRLVMKAIADDYDYVCYMHLGSIDFEDYVEEYKRSDFIKRLTNNWDGKKTVHDRINIVVDKLIAFDDKDRFIKNMKRANLIKKVHENLVYTESYKIHYMSLFYTYEVTFIADHDDNNSIVGMICGIRLVDEGKSKSNARVDLAINNDERQKRFDAMFVDDFEAAYLVNLDNNSFEIFKRSNVTELRNKVVPDFEVYARTYIEKDVYFEDREKLLALCNVENIKKALAHRKSFSVNYRDVSTGVPLYFKMRIIDAGSNCVGIGIMLIQQESGEEALQISKLEEQVRTQKEELFQKDCVINSLNKDMADLILNIVESRHENTLGHTEKMKELAYILGKQLQKDVPEYNLSNDWVLDVSDASNLHDVGKIAIPDSILYKPGKLTPEEFAIMKTHPEKGYELLCKFSKYWKDDYFKIVSDIARYHHERWNGEGYPKGLKGDDIPLCAQIVGLIDVFDALISVRVYKPPFTPDVALKMILNGECGSFNPKILKSLQNCFGEIVKCVSEKESKEEMEVSKSSFNVDKFMAAEDTALIALSQISEHMPGGFFVYQKETGNLLFFNDLLAKYFKCDNREDFIRHVNNSFKGIVHPDDYNDVISDIEKQINNNNEKLDHIRYRIKCKNGEERYVDDYGHLVHTEKYGDIYYVFLLDITDVKVVMPTHDVNIVSAKYDDDIKGRKILDGVRILLVDDNDLSRFMTKETLEEEGAVVSDYSSGDIALSVVKEVKPFDIILLDLIMPGMNGADLTREIRIFEQDKDFSSPIICITADQTSELATQAIRNGANGCMGKPLVISELARLLILSLKESSYLLQRKLDNTTYIANVDALTDVKNSMAYATKTKQISLELDKNKFHQFGIVMCDINGLKVANDSYGHVAGDDYIRNCTRLICETFVHSPVYRVGGDEFIVILEDVDYKHSKTLFQALRNAIALDAKINRYSNGLKSLAVGLALYDCKIDTSVQDVVKRADQEMYKDKRAEKAKFNK